MGCCKPDAGDRPDRDSSKEGLDHGALAKTEAVSTAGMIKLGGGTFWMGNEDSDAWIEDGEGPVREVKLSPFWIDRTAVTNEAFAAFIDATGYKTEAEQFGWSYVFHTLVPGKIKRRLGEGNKVQGLQWWIGVEGARWDKPEGPGSNIRKRLKYPVVHVTWNDAAAYARWVGKRLPTEAEWEYAARGGLEKMKYAWGNELTPGGKHMCNIWQGDFPHRDTAEDGYHGPAPAKSFPANGFGLYNMAGNVWEWCADWFSPTWHVPAKLATRENPKGPDIGESRVMRGGSFLCHNSYCNRYRVGARTANTPDSSTSNCGFRCAL